MKNTMSIVGIQFGITSPEEILRRSVVEVTTDKTHQGNNPVPGGVFDARLGVIESGTGLPYVQAHKPAVPGPLRSHYSGPPCRPLPVPWTTRSRS